MITRIVIRTLLILYIGHVIRANEDKSDENVGREFINKLDQLNAEQSNKLSIANWDYAANITKENAKKMFEVSAEIARSVKSQWKELITYPWQNYKDPDLKRKFKKYSILGGAALPDDQFQLMNRIVSQMQAIYSTAKICSYQDKTKCDLRLEPDLDNIFIKSDNPEELKHVWSEWRNASGKKVKNLFSHYVNISNEAALLNNFTDTSELWLMDYEDPTFRDQIAKLWDQLRPLYLQIHAYVRNKLRAKYGEKLIPKQGTLPAHLLGNMWSQKWENIYRHLIPYPEIESENVSDELVKQGYTPLKIFKTAENFFTSLNLSAMPETFWKNSILEKPKDGRELICHASAWDFYDGKDFRIKQCTKVEQNDFYTAHHEMGHIQYYLQYKDLSKIYQRGANPGFHEAVGDVISLSVTTNKHLHKIGLLKNYTDNPEATINKLMEIGLSKIVFLPFAYTMDLWRWDVFKGKTTPDHYNEEWWKLRQKFQGIHPPVTRTEDDFDPGAKYHIIASVPYIRYFVSFVIQFQIHQALCEKAGQYVRNDPEKALHKCDIYESKEAGNALAKLLQLGSSKPWHEAFETLTGTRNMNASALLEYFHPLQEWLEKENQKAGEHIGWNKNECSMCPI